MCAAWGVGDGATKLCDMTSRATNMCDMTRPCIHNIHRGTSCGGGPGNVRGGSYENAECAALSQRLYHQAGVSLFLISLSLSLYLSLYLLCLSLSVAVSISVSVSVCPCLCLRLYMTSCVTERVCSSFPLPPTHSSLPRPSTSDALLPPTHASLPTFPSLNADKRGSFSKYSLFYRALLQKRPIITGATERS